MNIIADNTRYSISLGGWDTWQTLCATIRYHLSPSKDTLANVFTFLSSGHCANCHCIETAREFNLVRDALSQLPPDQIIYDENDPSRQPPWGDKISPVITSCANYLTTGDGSDLLAEIVKLFTCAAYSKAGVEIS